MKDNKNKKKLEFTVKNVNKIGAIVVFILVFIFTFLVTCWSEGKNNIKWIGIGVGSAIGAVGIAWLTLALLARKKEHDSDPNKVTIDKALERLKKQEEEEKYQEEISRAKKEESK